MDSECARNWPNCITCREVGSSWSKCDQVCSCLIKFINVWLSLTMLNQVWSSLAKCDMEVATMCVARAPFPPSLAPVLLSVPFGHRWLNSWTLELEQVGSLPRSPIGNFPNLKTSWWRSQLTFRALGRLDCSKPPLGVFTPERKGLFNFSWPFSFHNFG